MTFRDPQDNWWARVFAARWVEKRPSPPRRRPEHLPRPRGTVPRIPSQRTEPPF
ncbi:hypothetical protein K377_05979 [Streptomyces sp. PsTaAH-137]|nr:hypothetical protein K377_05979 [Streptomyces sp. PsTaAH-137]